MKATSRTFRCAIAAGMGMIGMVAPVSISLTEIMPGLVGRMNTTAGCRSAISMTIPKRYNPSVPLCQVYTGAINRGEPVSRGYYRRMAAQALSEFTPGDNLLVELSDYFYDANPFAGNDSMLAEAIWAEAIRHYWLRATGQPIKEAPVPIPGWEQGRIDQLKARVKRLHAGNKVAHMIGCTDMTVYQVLGENQYYRPSKRAEWLAKIEQAVSDIEGFRVYVKRMIERESDRRTA